VEPAADPVRWQVAASGAPFDRGATWALFREIFADLREEAPRH
jgi:hypothetical protein